MADRATRRIPYAQLTVLAALMLVVITTSPFSSVRPTTAEGSPSRTSPASPHHRPLGGDGATSLGGALQPETGDGQSVPSWGRPGPDPHELAAERAAAQLLAEVRIPVGAVPVLRAPAGTPDMGGPPQEIAVEQLVDDHRFWIVPGTPEVVLDWFGAHPIPGSALVGHGSAGTYGVQQLLYDTFSLTPLGQVLLPRDLMMGVAQDRAGKVILRVDTQIVWDPTRPSQSMVPKAGARIVATDTPQQGGTGKIGPSRSRNSSDTAVVHHFVDVVNAMPEATSGFTSCPAFSGDRYTLVFQSGAGVTLATVTLYEDACFGISVKVTGVASVSLFDPGQALLNALKAFLSPFDR